MWSNAVAGPGPAPAHRERIWVHAQGVFFIDRDPKFFQLILNFMRDGWCSGASYMWTRLGGGGVGHRRQAVGAAPALVALGLWYW